MNDATQKQVIIIYGNPVNGFSYIGPFATRNDAIDNADKEPVGMDWWIADLDPPQGEGARDDGSDAWAEHQGHPIADWQYEVANGDTRRGYRDWCFAREAFESELEPMEA